MNYKSFLGAMALATVLPIQSSAESKPEAIQRLEELIGIAQEELSLISSVRPTGGINVDPYCGKGYFRTHHVGLTVEKSEIDLIGPNETRHLQGSYFVYHISVKAEGKPLEYTVEVQRYPVALSANTEQFNPTLNQRDSQYGIQLKMEDDKLELGIYGDKPFSGEDRPKLYDPYRATLKNIFERAVEKAKPVLTKCTPRNYKEGEYHEGWDEDDGGFIFFKFSNDGKLIP